MKQFENIKIEQSAAENEAEKRQRIKKDIIFKAASKLAEEDAEKRWEGRPIKDNLQSHYDADRVKKAEEIRAELEAVYDKYGDMILSAPNPEEAIEKLYLKEKNIEKAAA